VHKLPSVAQVQASFKSSDRAILDRYGQVIDEIRVEKRVRRLNWVKVEQVPPSFVDALLQAEDHRFLLAFRKSIPWAMVKALFTRVTGGGVRGASTLTMQLSELIDNPDFTKWRVAPYGPAEIESSDARSGFGSVVEQTRYSRGLHQSHQLSRRAPRHCGPRAMGLFDKTPSALTRRKLR